MASATGYRYSIEFLNSQLKRMATNWPRPLSEEEANEMRHNFGDVLADVGEERFRDAVDDAIKYHPTFFPSVAEFRTHIPEHKAVDPNQKYCPRCRGLEGFERCEVKSNAGTITMGVRRCKHV